MALFTAASLLCALASSLTVLLAGRILQGLGASAVMAANVALIRFISPPQRIGRALGWNALTVGTCFALGPTVASGILSVATWPWLFAVNAPVGLLGLLAAKALPETPRAAPAFDAGAAALGVVAFAAVGLALDEAARGQFGRTVGTEVAIAALCGSLLLRRQARHPAPILAFDLLRRPLFALSALTATGAFAAQGLAFVSLPFLFQHGLGRSPVETGILLTPWPAAVAAIGPFAGRLSDRIPPGLLGGLGLGALGAGMFLLAELPAAPSIVDIAWRMVVCGLGFGLFQAPNLRAFLTSVPPARSGSASGFAALVRLIGQNTGAALVAGCLALAGERGPVLALALGGGCALLASLVSWLRLANWAGKSSSD